MCTVDLVILFYNNVITETFQLQVIFYTITETFQLQVRWTGTMVASQGQLAPVDSFKLSGQHPATAVLPELFRIFPLPPMVEGCM